jgi:peptide deformylase
MALLPIIEYPHPTLTKIARDVAPIEINDDLRRLIKDMIDTMIEAPGVGLAAPQVNISKRLFVVDVSSEYPDRPPFALINPVILEAHGRTKFNEGCLSLPEFREDVERSKFVKMSYLDEFGKPQILEDEGFLAIVVQHELDHLNGVVAADRVSPMKKMMYLKKLKKRDRTSVAAL